MISGLALSSAAVSAQFGPSTIGSAEAAERSRADRSHPAMSIVSEDWRFRMVVPPKATIRISPRWRERRLPTRGIRRRTRAGDHCKAWRANIMPVPDVSISRADDYTLKIEADAGTQTQPCDSPAPGKSVPAILRRGRGARPRAVGEEVVARGRQSATWLSSIRGVPFGNLKMVEHSTSSASRAVKWLIDDAILPTRCIARSHKRNTPAEQSDSTGWDPPRAR